MKVIANRLLLLISVILLGGIPLANAQAPGLAGPGARERLLMDSGWRFAFGHPSDTGKDFNHATDAFSYYAKAGNGDGAAAPEFNDSAWRKLDLPHDWAVEMPFDPRGSGSHGSKAIGRNFPDRSVGWYRKSFYIPASDSGKRISIEFDGVFRDSLVWVNGFFLGNEKSGYTSFAYNLTECLNYGGNNVIAVRVDASMEEGWFYEGSGIYRHVWLVKTAPLHIERNGTFVTSEVKENSADVTARASIVNEGTNSVEFGIEHTILDSDGKTIASVKSKQLRLGAGEQNEFTNSIAVANPRLWSIETPNMHKLVTIVRADGAVVDRYETPFGIRSIRFDANEGFFLNGKHVKLHGSNNHQDHAGVGVAIPDALQEFRIAQLKKFGCNAYRASHNPPTPELLDACDRLGMVVIDENRLMGVTDYHFDHLKAMMLRDRNHPSIILWSLGNEEWKLEWTDQGTRIAASMRAAARRWDTTRPTTLASSGGWGHGDSIPIDVMGFNYYVHGNTDEYHSQSPNKPSVGTEECSSFSTRGIYVEDLAKAHLTAYDKNAPTWGALAEKGWNHHADRPYIGGLFIWTGFDYRGETTPFGWPAISSQFGILDTCGFFKDNAYFYKSWWTDQPVLHVLPHWNWAGKEGQEIEVWCHSNCEEVELFLNGESQGRKPMKRNSHLEWKVKYAPGALLARGYNGGKEVLTDKVETTGEPGAIQLIPHRPTINADGEDISVVTVQVNDAQGRMVPTAANEISFTLNGPGKIIGVGNGDPSSHEPDKNVEQVSSLSLTDWRMATLEKITNAPELAYEFDDSGWQAAFSGRRGNRNGNRGTNAQAAQFIVYRAKFDRPDTNRVSMTLLLRSLGQEQMIYVNGQFLTNAASKDINGEFPISNEILRPGKNVIAVVAADGSGGKGDLSNPGQIRVVTSPDDWKRSLFNGLAQVIVQSTQKRGQITLKASSGTLSTELKLETRQVALRPSIP